MGESVNSYSALGLAYIGDAVYELMIRRHVIEEANRPVEKLHRAAVKYVNAAAQAALVDSVMDKLTEDELAVYKRGRNSKPNTMPKNQSSADYHKATGFEALVGWLYLQGNTDRINELFAPDKEK